ncbi:hypothetical protein GEMRC1_004529 [Eukaryota sp. GEM-RC1]
MLTSFIENIAAQHVSIQTTSTYTDEAHNLQKELSKCFAGLTSSVVFTPDPGCCPADISCPTSADAIILMNSWCGQSSQKALFLYCSSLSSQLQSDVNSFSQTIKQLSSVNCLLVIDPSLLHYLPLLHSTLSETNVILPFLNSELRDKCTFADSLIPLISSDFSLNLGPFVWKTTSEPHNLVFLGQSHLTHSIPRFSNKLPISNIFHFNSPLQTPTTINPSRILSRRLFAT